MRCWLRWKASPGTTSVATPSCKTELVIELECLTFPASRWGDSPLCTLLLTMLIVRYPCLSAFNPMPSSWRSHWWRSGPIRKECLHILQVGSDTSLEWFVRPVFSIRRPPIITSTTIQPLSGKSGGSLAPWAMGNSSANAENKLYWPRSSLCRTLS